MIKCFLLHIIGRLMDWAWLFASDPFNLFGKTIKKLSGAFDSQIKFLSAVLGATLVFIGMNVTVYAAKVPRTLQTDLETYRVSDETP